MSERVRVVIADDHAPTRAGVRASLEHGGFEIVGEAADATAVVDVARQERPDVCLLDIHMPGSGIAAATRITDELPNTAVVMLTVSRNDDDLFDALRAGASGYLLKDTDPARLPFALRGVLSGEAALPRTLVARLIDEFRDRGRYRRVPVLGARGAMLTSREWQVLELLREGLSTKDIAERLFLSPATIRSHVAAILRKLKVPDRAAAIRLLDGRSN
ncbi:MAG: response regulator transcription factor [Actinomycetota bacterium]|nr:response regulator transcription factor [Actinomycetota bacterium]